MYGVATYTEGDITIDAYPSAADRDHALDLHAAWHWRHTGNGPTVPEIGPLLPEHTGPYQARTPDPAPLDPRPRGPGVRRVHRRGRPTLHLGVPQQHPRRVLTYPR